MDFNQIADKVSEERLQSHLANLAAIGGTGDGGVNRQVLTEGDRAARNYLVNLAHDLDLTVETDEIGNQFFRINGTAASDAPAITTGSHLDTQPTGGRLDGVYGVVAGFEAIAAMRDAGFQPDYPIEIVNWTNEEGCRFAPGCMGSMAHVGAKSLKDFADIKDQDGISFSQALRETLAQTEQGRPRALGQSMRAYVELHIEQGPVLESQGVPVGIVSSIQGCRWFEVEILGATSHAGTTPMRMRRDALQEAVNAIHSTSAAMSDPEDILRFTIGKLSAEPGAPNVVPNRVSFTIDLRHPDIGRLDEAEAIISATIGAQMRDCTCRITRNMAYSPTPFDGSILAVIDRAAQELNIHTRKMSSGAFHDALHIAGFAPSAMIFVSSIGGISHNPKEATSRADLTAGAKVLTSTLARLSINSQ